MASKISSSEPPLMGVIGRAGKGNPDVGARELAERVVADVSDGVSYESGLVRRVISGLMYEVMGRGRLAVVPMRGLLCVLVGWLYVPCVTMVLPLDALGAAAAVAQFVECGVKLAREAYEIYNSGDGVSRRAQALRERCNSLRELGQRMQSQLDADKGSKTDAEKRLGEVAGYCRIAADELLALLEDLKTDGSRNVLKSTSVAVKAKHRQPKILELSERLDQLQLRLQLCLQEVMSDRQSRVCLVLDRIASADRDMEARLASKLDTIQQELINANGLAHRDKVPTDGHMFQQDSTVSNPLLFH